LFGRGGGRGGQRPQHGPKGSPFLHRSEREGGHPKLLKNSNVVSLPPIIDKNIRYLPHRKHSQLNDKSERIILYYIKRLFITV